MGARRKMKAYDSVHRPRNSHMNTWLSTSAARFHCWRRASRIACWWRLWARMLLAFLSTTSFEASVPLRVSLAVRGQKYGVYTNQRAIDVKCFWRFAGVLPVHINSSHKFMAIG